MYTDDLLNTAPFEFSDRNKSLFIKSLKEVTAIHYEGNEFFKFYWDRSEFLPTDISEETLEQIPFLMVNLFKHHEFITGDKENIILTLGSSGTGGQRSMIHLDKLSLERVKKLAYNIHADLGMTSDKKYNYLCFTYDPQVAKDLGTAFTDELLTGFTNKAEVFYTFQHDGDDFVFDKELTVKKLKQFEASPYPTRILGFPAFLYEIIREFDLKLSLGSDSWVQTGGGWKAKADKEISKKDFREIVSSSLGIPKSNIRDLFGMVEHGIPYVDCEKGSLRIPNYSRVIIRDPKSLQALPLGERGLIQFICTYNTSYPAMSLLTTDWGRVTEDSFSKILHIEGRAGVSKNKGCAIKALEILN